MTKETRKFIVYGLMVITWIGFWTYMDQSAKDEISESLVQTSKIEKSPTQVALEKCQKVRTEGERLDKVSANLVAEAKKLQRIWIIQEMSNLKDEGKITPSEWKTFSDYMSKPLGESATHILEVIDLLDKVVKNGYIKPYLPQNVVKVGNQAAQSESSSNYYVNFPECFSKIDYDMYKLVADIPKSRGTWARKLESSFELIP